MKHINCKLNKQIWTKGTDTVSVNLWKSPFTHYKQYSTLQHTFVKYYNCVNRPETLNIVYPGHKLAKKYNLLVKHLVYFGYQHCSEVNILRKDNGVITTKYTTLGKDKDYIYYTIEPAVHCNKSILNALNKDVLDSCSKFNKNSYDKITEELEQTFRGISEDNASQASSGLELLLMAFREYLIYIHS